MRERTGCWCWRVFRTVLNRARLPLEHGVPFILKGTSDACFNYRTPHQCATPILTRFPRDLPTVLSAEEIGRLVKASCARYRTFVSCLENSRLRPAWAEFGKTAIVAREQLKSFSRILAHVNEQ
jgi:hypothetical protein